VHYACPNRANAGQKGEDRGRWRRERRKKSRQQANKMIAGLLVKKWVKTRTRGRERGADGSYGKIHRFTTVRKLFVCSVPNFWWVPYHVLLSWLRINRCQFASEIISSRPEWANQFLELKSLHRSNPNAAFPPDDEIEAHQIWLFAMFDNLPICTCKSIMTVLNSWIDSSYPH
jgi:hypothetical protein